MYLPKVELGFEPRPPVTQARASLQLERMLARASRLSPDCRIEVSVAERTAMLRGEVPSATDRELVELLVSFEPGISAVQNELVVNPEIAGSGARSRLSREEQSRRRTWTVLSNSQRPRDSSRRRQ
jgi:hypothetical protein